MAGYTQKTRHLRIETPLGKDVLLVTRFSGYEEMSRLFSYRLDLVSEKESIEANDIVGRGVTITLTLHDGSERCFNGIVSAFAYCGASDRLSRYSAEVVPWLWFLTRTADCRIFQAKSVPAIVEQVFKDLGFTDYEIADIDKSAHEPWDFCVQYRETDFNFVSRLMEKEGIFYYFRHEKGKHVLVLADRKSTHKDCAEKEVSFESDHPAGITSWRHGYEYRPGKWAQTDFNFETPTAGLMAKTSTLVKLQDNTKFEVYDYPGAYSKKAVGDAEVKIRMEEAEAGYEIVSGTSNCRTFFVGGKFTMKKFPSSRAEEGKQYVITMLRHEASTGGTYETGGEHAQEYQNAFTCVPEAITFRPARVTFKPVVYGAQTAIVVGPSGQEIYTDKYGRVKVQFHWDREGKKNENSSCWVRVSHPWAGKGWGAVAIPRIGQEVIVDFLEGDPDRPIITGRVYNADCMPPFDLPDQAMVSGVKSDSTPGGGGYNEITLDDTKGDEKITIHGEHDMSRTIEHDSSEVVKNNETLNVGGNRTRSVGKNEIVSVGITRTHSVGANEMINVGGAQEINVGGLQALNVGAEQAINVGLNQDVAVGKNQSTSVGEGRETKVGKDDKLDVEKKLVITAGEEITIKTGKASIVMKKDGTITLDGKDITIKGSGAISVKASKDIVMKGSKVLQN